MWIKLEKKVIDFASASLLKFQVKNYFNIYIIYIYIYKYAYKLKEKNQTQNKMENLML